MHAQIHETKHDGEMAQQDGTDDEHKVGESCERLHPGMCPTKEAASKGVLEDEEREGGSHAGAGESSPRKAMRRSSQKRA
jgi:hypothetical protein